MSKATSPRAGLGSGSGWAGATIRGRAARSSPIRAAAPAAWLTSLQTSDIWPSELAPSTANSTNCDSAPPVMLWSITLCAPSQSTMTTLEKARNSAATVTKARALVILRAAS